MHKILIVDDERSISKLMQYILEGKGYKADVAYNGVEALEKIKRFKPDLLLLDVNMPQMDGWQVLECVRSLPETAPIKVMMCTERNTMGDIEKSDRLGVQGYITKPFIMERVLKKIDDLLNA